MFIFLLGLNTERPCQLTTQWTSQVDPENVLPEYPRPQMVRGKTYFFEIK
jgi:hypothetical protein